MKRDFKFFTTTFVVSLAVFPPAFAQDARAQFAANAGLTAAEAQGLSLQELAVLNHNLGARRDDEQVIVMHDTTGSVDARARTQLVLAAGVAPAEAAGLSLDELTVLKHNSDVRRDDQIIIVSGRSADVSNAGHAQFAASTGIDADAARGMTLDEIYVLRIEKLSSDN
jgi:hypothetical protein